MKNTFCALVVLVLFIIGGYVECHYTCKAKIIDITQDEITIADNRGEEWVFEGSGFEVGQTVKVTFNTNGTDNTFYDDKIEKVRVDK